MADEKKTEPNNKKLIDALIMAQSQMTFASKTGTNPHFKSGYAPLEEVIDAVKKPLNDNGIFFLQKVYISEGGQCVETEFHGWDAVLRGGKVFVPSEKQTPQGYAGALTYAKRYSLATACALPSGDDDGNEAEDEIQKKLESKKTPVKKIEPVKEKAPVKKDNSKTDMAKTFLELISAFIKEAETEEEITAFVEANIGRVTALEKYPDLNKELNNLIENKTKELEENGK